MTFSAKIYKLYVTGLEEFCYIGSTTQPLSDRLKKHKYTAKTAKYTCASAVLFEEGNEPVMECLEDVTCETKQALLERERYWLDQFPDAINKHDPILSSEERHERIKATSLKCYYAKREERIAKHREWLKAHAKEIAEQRSTPEHLAKARAQEKARYDAGYKATRNEAKKVKVECPTCKKVMNKSSLWEHNKKLHPAE
jgi:hypothetical protein